MSTGGEEEGQNKGDKAGPSLNSSALSFAPTTPPLSTDISVDLTGLKRTQFLNGLSTGCLVELTDLQHAPHFNGLKGRILRYFKRERQWAVRLQSRDEIVKVKLANITYVSPSPVDRIRSFLDNGSGIDVGSSFDAVPVSYSWR